MRTLTIIHKFVLGTLFVTASSCAIETRSPGDDVETRSAGDAVTTSRNVSAAPGECEGADEAATADLLDGADTAACSVVCGTHCCKAPANFCGRNNACCDGVHCTVNCPCVD